MGAALLCGCAHNSGGAAQSRGNGERYVSPSAYEHYIQARLYALEEDHARAVDELREALVSDPESPELRVRMADQLLRLGRFDAAQTQLDQALRIDPAYGEAYLVQADLQQARGNRAGALAALRKAVAANPTLEDAWLELARTQSDAGDAKGSRETLAALVRRIPDSVDGHFHHANALANEGDMGGAIRELERTLALDAAHTDARVRLSELLLATGKRAESLEMLREGLDVSDDRLVVAEPLVELLLRNGDVKAARDVVETVDVDETDPLRKIALANLYRVVQGQERARELVDEALRVSSDLTAARLLSAALYEDEKRSDAAIGEYRKIPPDAKEYPGAVRQAELLLRSSGRAAEGRKLVEASLRERSDSEELLVLAAELDQKEGELPRAIERLEAALKKRPTSELLLFGLGTALERSGEWRRAVELMRQILAVNPKSPAALNFIGYVQAERGIDLEQAEQMIRQAMALDPSNGYIVDSLGWCLYKRGKLDESIATLQEATRLVPGEPEILRHLGDVFVAAKDRARAAETYRRALEGMLDGKLRKELESTLRELEAGKSARRPVKAR